MLKTALVCQKQDHELLVQGGFSLSVLDEQGSAGKTASGLAMKDHLKVPAHH